MKNLISKLFIFSFLILGIVFLTQVSANPADIDPSFDTGTPIGFNGPVYSSILQSNGKILVGGSFSSYLGHKLNRFIRLNSDGTIDTTFDIGNGFNSTVRVIKIQEDGKILVGGSFNGYDGASAYGLIRLNQNGSRDNTFYPGYLSEVYSIAIQNDGKILVGGTFSNRIIRLDSDGSVDTGFDVGAGFNGSVNSISIQEDGKILVGGQFTTYQGISQSKISRLNQNGTIDNSFNIGTGFDSSVNSISIQEDGKILVGGDFSIYQGISYRGIISLTESGSINTNFIVGNGFNVSVGYGVNDIIVKEDGAILVGGGFTTYQGQLVSSLVELDFNGNISRDGNDFNLIRINAILYSGNILYLGLSDKPGLKSIDLIDWSINDNFYKGDGFSTWVPTFDIQDDGKIIVAGYFTTIYRGLSISPIIRLKSDGSIDEEYLGTGFGNNYISKIKIDKNGKSMIGGGFLNYKGILSKRLIRLNEDGTKDVDFNVGEGFDSVPNDIVIQDDGKILVGGEFTTYQGSGANSIIRLNSDGSRDTGFVVGSGFNGNVNSIVVNSSGKILVGGYFTEYQGSGANRIIRLNNDGSRDTGFEIVNGFNNMVSSIAEDNDGKILVGGFFTTYQSSSTRGIARLNDDGTIDNSFDIGGGFTLQTQTLQNGFVQSIAVDNDGKIIVGGDFNHYDTNRAYNIIRLDSDGGRDTGFNIGEGFNSRPNNIIISSSGGIFLGGAFTSYKGIPAGSLIKLYGDSNLVIIPDSTNTGTVESEFTGKGYVRSGINLVGSTAISLELIDGNIPVDLNLKNEDIQLNIPANTQFKKKIDNSNYDGIISVPVLPSTEIYSIFDRVVISKFNVGSSSEPTILEGGMATLRVPVAGKSAGDVVYIYYAEDNGVSWYPKTVAMVQDDGGDLYVEFSTDQLTEFSILDGDGVFKINNGDITTTGLNVELNIEATGVQNMRFSNDNSNWSSRENFETIKSWMLEGVGGIKTVYVELDTDGDNINDIETNDTIIYDYTDITAPIGTINYSTTGATNEDVIATISLNETGAITNNSGSLNYTFTGNGSFTFEFEDEAGNTGEKTAEVTWIDRVNPIITGVVNSGVYTTTATFSVTDNVAVSGVKLNGENITGRIDLTLTEIKTHTITATDTAGNETQVTFEIKKAVSSGGGGGGGGSYIPPVEEDEEIEVETGTVIGTGEVETGIIIEKTVEEELEESYNFAKEKKITTTKDIEEFDTDGVLIRKHLAKMISEFAIQVMGKEALTGTITDGCEEFEDMGEETAEMKGYAIVACKLGLMGWNSDQKSIQKTFNPDVEINRAQFGTILSRLLRGSTYATEDSLKYYEKHLLALNSKGIIKVIEPEMRELRGWVILMLYRVREGQK